MIEHPAALSSVELAQTRIDWQNLIWVGVALAIMIVAIVINDL